MSFGEKLTKLRKEKGMSQEDLANSLNVSRQAVSKWESNSSYPETEKIVAICKLFNCSIDEIIGLKDSKIKKENKTLNILNEYFDKFIKGIKMFYAMTFKQKVKCLIEMCFYALVLFVMFMFVRVILIEIIRKLLSILPYELLSIIIQIFDGLYYLVFLTFSIYALVKLYKVRYLDYYENYLKEENNSEPEIIKEEIKEDKKKIKIKEEKIIIRDPNNNFKPFAWIKKSIILFFKFIALLFSICFGITFVLLVAIIIFTLYFVKSGILIFYIALCLFGTLICIYIFLEIFIKYIFNMKQSPKRLFITFIVSMITIGLSSGLFACEIITYKYIDTFTYNEKVLEEQIKMEDNLIIDFLIYSDAEIIYEDRKDIKIEFYANNDITSVYFRNYTSTKRNVENNVVINKKYKIYEYYTNDIYNGNSIYDIIKYVLSFIEDKTIITDDAFYAIPKVYISEENYDKIVQNYEEYFYRNDYNEYQYNY